MNTELDIRGGAMRRDMARRLCMFGFDELRVVDSVMVRLELGRERYGNLDVSKPREWRRELREELLDALIYDLAEELARKDAERAQLHEDARKEIAVWEASQKTAISNETSELAAREPARVALDDIAEHPYDFFDLSGVEVS